MLGFVRGPMLHPWSRSAGECLQTLPAPSQIGRDAHSAVGASVHGSSTQVSVARLDSLTRRRGGPAEKKPGPHGLRAGATGPPVFVKIPVSPPSGRGPQRERQARGPPSRHPPLALRRTPYELGRKYRERHGTADVSRWTADTMA